MSITARTGDVAVHIQTRGIDCIPDAERHGRSRSLFGIWAAANVLYLNVVFGGILVLLGIDLWESALGGADPSSIAGPALAASAYALLWRTMRPYRDPAACPTAAAASPRAPAHPERHNDSIADHKPVRSTR